MATVNDTPASHSDVRREVDRQKLLADAIIEIAEAAGMGHFTQSMTGPEVLVVAKDVADFLRVRLAPVSPMDSDGPWGIEDDLDPTGNYWNNRWHVRTDRGEGTHLATFEFLGHAEQFVERCGPRAERTLP